MSPEEKIARMQAQSFMRTADRNRLAEEARIAERERRRKVYALVKAEAPDFFNELQKGAEVYGWTYAAIGVKLPGRDPVRMK